MKETNNIVVIGAGGYGRHVLDILEAVNAQRVGNKVYTILGVLDDNPSDLNLERLHRRSYRYLGTTRDWLQQGDEVGFVVGIGAPQTKQLLAGLFQRYGLSSPVLVHPDATIHSVVDLGPGTVVSAGARIGTNSRLAEHVHINYNATIGHDAVIGPYCSIFPGANVAGSVEMGSGCLVGSGSQILQELKVGKNATIAAAACVVKDVPDNSTAIGVPARLRQ